MVGLQGSRPAPVQGPASSSREVGGTGVLSARRREARQQRVVAELLAEGRTVVVDNTNPAPADRAPLIALAQAAGVPVRAVVLDTPVELCLARNDARPGWARVPLVGVLGTRARLVPPTVEEGFDRVEVVRADG